MTNRKNTLLIKRSNVPGKIPSPGDLQLGELALNTADVVLYASGTTTNEILPIGWDRLSTLSGGTVNGNIISTGSISATTYYGDGSNLTNIPDYYVTGGTYNSGTLTLNRQNGSVTITGLTSTALSATSLYVDYIDFNTGATVTQYPGRVNWDAGTGTLNIAVGDTTTGLIDLQVGQEEIVRVYNDEATTLQKGEIVYVSGSQGNRPKVKRAQAQGDLYSVTTLGMVDLAIAPGAEGYVTTFGIISNLNTLGLTGGTPIWLSPTTPGGYTEIKPKAPDHTVLIGYVVRVSATIGSVFVNISNGWELDEIHDVRISAATEGDLLVRSSYSGSPVWVNTKTLNGNYTINGSLTITGASNLNYIDFDTTQTGTTSSPGRLFWDVNNRTLSLGMLSGVTQQIGEESYYLVEANSNIINGRVVGAVGTTGPTNKILADYIIADGSVPSITILGIATQSLSAGTTGYITEFGLVRDIDTTGTPYGEVWNNGDILYVSPTIPGGLTRVKPLSPDLSIVVAIVIYANASNGSIFVRPSIISSLADLSDVRISTGATTYDILQYDATGEFWYNTNKPYLPSLSAGTITANTINSVSISATTFYGDGLGLNNIPISGVTNLQSSLDNKTDLVLFNSHTGDTNNPHQTTFFNLVSTAHTHSISDIVNLQTSLNNKFDVSGGTITGSVTINNNLTVSGLTALTYNIQSPVQDNNLDDFLVVDGNGNFFTRNYNSVSYIPNFINVSLTGGSADYSSVKAAVDSITGASATNPWVVKVRPGVYYEDPIQMKSYVAVVGDNSTTTIIEAKDPNQTLIYGADQSMIQDCQIQGCTGTSVAAVVYSSSTTPQLNAIFYVENVRFGSNYTHVKNVGTGGGNSIIQCSNVKYGGYPFTLGFYCTNDGTGVGRMQLRNVTSTNGGVVTATGLTFAKADKSGCGFIVNGALLTKAVGAAAGTGFWVEDGGFLRLTGVNFQRWSTGIYAPQVGSAPSIDAISLNFENCTTDVNIIHSGTTGKIQGTDSFLKTLINIDAPIYEVNTDPREIIVAKKGGDFSSIKSAVDYLVASATTSSSSRYIISVGPGIFTENEIDLTNTPYVSIVGSNIQTTLIKPATNSQHIIKVGINNEISFLSLSGAPSGYAGLYLYDIGDFGQAHKISMYDCNTNVWVESDTQDTKFYGEYLDFNGDYTYGTKVIGNNGYLALANMENYFNFPTGTGVTYCNYATGSGATINAFVGDTVSNGVSGSTAFYIQDGAELNASTITSDGFTYGILNPNIGDPIRFDVDNASFVNGEWDLYVERNGTFGTFGGSSNHEKIFTVSDDVYWAFLDINDGEFDITRKASVTFTDGSHTDFTTLIFEGSTMGLLSGGSLSVVSGTTIQADGGFGYVEKSDNSGIVRRIDWSNTQVVLPSYTDSYIFINENANLSTSGSRPNSDYNIILGRVVTNNNDVEFIDLSPIDAEHTSNKFDKLFSDAVGPIYANGSIVTEGTSAFTLDVTAGEYFFSTNEYLPVGGTGVTFNQYYRNGTGSTWVVSATTLVNNTQYDNNGTLTGLTSSYYTKHTLYLVGEGALEHYFLVLGQNEYSTLVATEDAPLPTPPSYFTDSVTQIANIYIQEGTSGITQIEDIRPTIGFRAGGVNASSVHGNLLGLNADDHTQYLLVSGTRAMSGNLNMGSNDITTVGTVDGVTVSAHATRHQFGGADPVGSVTPSANAIPYADVSGTLDSWISTASTTTLGKVKLSVSPILSSNPIVIGDNDTRVSNALTGGSFNNITNTLTLVRNGGVNLDITGFTSTDYFVTGGTFDSNTDTLTLNRQNGNVTITGITDYFVTGGTFNSGTSTLTLNRQDGNVTITGFTSGGEVNTASNLGSGTGVFAQKSGVDLQFKSLTSTGGTITISNDSTTINLESQGGLKTKAGSVGGASFSGNPKKYTVTFGTAFADANYSISLSSGVNRNFTYESKTASSFVINANANTSFTEDVDWTCVKHGES